MEFLIEELYDVARDALHNGIYRDIIASRVQNATYLIVLRDQNRKAMGFTANEQRMINQTQTNCYGTSFFRRGIQNQFALQNFDILRYELSPADALILSTQNPLEYRNFARLCIKQQYHLFPNGTAISQEAYLLASAYCKETTRDLIVQGFYAHERMDNTPLPESTDEKETWRKMQLDKGDAVIVVGIRQ